MFCTPVSGSRVMTLVAVSVGALSKPGVEIGIGSAVEPVPFALEGRALDHHLVARRAWFTMRGAIGCAIAWSHFAWISATARAHADACRWRGWRRSRRPPPACRICGRLPVDDVGEEERLALGLVHAADELPAHQRMQLGILVDRPVDGQEKSRLPERGQMLVQIGIETVRIAQ